MAPSTTSDTVLHTSLNNPSAKAVVEISQRETGDQAADITEDLATDDSLWDKAYDNLSEEKHDLITKYEYLLSQVLIRGKPSV